MHTNDPTLDPDFWVSRQGPGGPKYIYLRWATLDFYHLYEYLVRTGSGPRRSGSRRSFYLYEVGKIFLIGLSLTVIDLKTLLFYWVVPSRLCILLLAYLFDYLPHAPHQVAKRTDKYGTTAYLSVPEFLAPIAKYLLFYQNYHLIHHLFPRYPFYQMYRIWVEMKRDLLVEKSVPVTRVLHFLGKETLFEAPLDLTGLVRDLDLTGLVRDKQAEDFLSDVRTDLQREEPYLPFPKGLLTKEIGRAYDRVSRSYLDSQTRWITYFYQVRDALSKEA
jgi:fatty acid desaturase